MKRSKKIVICSILILAALLIAAGITLYISSIMAYEFCMDCFSSGWEKNLKYSMLSSDLKNVISEEEFNDNTPESRLELYRKLDGLVLDERPTEKFHGSTHGFKTPYIEVLEINGEEYFVEITIETMGRLTGIEVRNFYCYLYKRGSYVQEK